MRLITQGYGDNQMIVSQGLGPEFYTYIATIAESLSNADEITRRTILSRLSSDILATTDLLSSGLPYSVTISDTLAHVDTLSRVGKFKRDYYDEAITSEALSRKFIAGRALTDLLQSLEEIRSGFRFTRGTSDAITVTDSLIRLAKFFRELSDISSTLETLERIGFFKPKIVDITSFLEEVYAEKVGEAYGREISDISQLTEELRKTLTGRVRKTDDTSQFSDEIERRYYGKRGIVELTQTAEALIASFLFKVQSLDNLLNVEEIRQILARSGRISEELQVASDVVGAIMGVVAKPSDVLLFQDVLGRKYYAFRYPEDAPQISDAIKAQQIGLTYEREGSSEFAVTEEAISKYINLVVYTRTAEEAAQFIDDLISSKTIGPEYPYIIDFMYEHIMDAPPRSSSSSSSSAFDSCPDVYPNEVRKRIFKKYIHKKTPWVVIWEEV